MPDEAREKPKRTAKETRPQLICILADNSTSMSSPPDKAHAATDGIRNLILRCQALRLGVACYKILLIRFGQSAAIDRDCDLKPVTEVDPDSITIQGDGGETDITGALHLAMDRLRPYMQQLQSHSDRAKHPLPLVLLFSDGEHNVGDPPLAVAGEVKRLSLDGESVVLAVAGVSVGEPAEKMLSEIASPGFYCHVNNPERLAKFIAEIGSSVTRETAKQRIEAFKKGE